MIVLDFFLNLVVNYNFSAFVEKLQIPKVTDRPNASMSGPAKTAGLGGSGGSSPLTF